MNRLHTYYVLGLIFLFFACKKTTEEKPLLHVPDDLEVTLWASSPMFYNPTNVDVDMRGRLWVTEAVNYRDFRNKDGHMVHAEGDRIVILEDTNGDGKADSSKIFVQDSDLRSPLGIAVVGNQVIVSCSPSIIVYTDEDGDDIPDHKEILLTGFGGKDHDHGLHAGVLGPDGKWYFIVGNAGPHEVTGRDGWTLRSGSVYNEYTPYSTENTPSQVSDDGKVYTGGMVIRVNPDGTGLEVLSHNFRNAFEVFVDSFGNMWQSDNDDQTASCRTTWLMEGSNAGFFSEQGDRTWQADRRPGQSIAEAHWHQHDPGVLPAGDIYGAGSPTGIVRVENDALGEHYRGLLLSADAGRNIIFGYFPTPQGSGYSLNERQAFISSVDTDNVHYVWHEIEEDDSKWFRPSDVAVGTDGSLFVADWYDPIVGGHQMRDKEGYGRIYRIHPKNKQLTSPVISLDEIPGQIEALYNPAIHVRSLAAQALLAQSGEAVPALAAVLKDNNPFHQARAIWLLSQLGDTGWAAVEPYLEDRNPELALTALRALSQFRGQELLAYSKALAKSAHPLVRRELALLLKDFPLNQSLDIYLQLFDGFDGVDPWYRNAMGIGLRGKENAFYPALMSHLGGPDPVEWPDAASKMVWELHPAAAMDDLRQRVTSEKLDENKRKEAMETLAFIGDKDAAQIVLALYEGNDDMLSEDALWWLQFRQHNLWQSHLKNWESPVDNLPDAQPELLAWRNTLLDSLASPEEKSDVWEKLSENSNGRLHLALLAATGKLSGELKKESSQLLEKENRAPIKSLLARHFQEKKKTYSEEKISQSHADVQMGKTLTEKNCLGCHKIGNSGNEIGPDLSQIQLKMDRKTLINAITEPDAAVAFGSEAFLVSLKNGAVLYGILLSNGPVVTVQEYNGRKFIIPANEIEQRRQLKHSLMPAPEHMDLEENDVTHITAYLLDSRGGTK
ncbi:PVC-type heme-binding CxxCH protein [Negadavirga shengliensis]|uniref:PVC-type heme-binding CxxCH protein n=1 Tax=Negadavirga shengliensis TaxID=1389218 RepID=A0ABV9T155_9BACT